MVHLTIEDDGNGINKENLKGRMGLRIMSYRAKMIGATFDIENRPEGGTRVSFKFKL
jgi:signal transduction histidine kinase